MDFWFSNFANVKGHHCSRTMRFEGVGIGDHSQGIWYKTGRAQIMEE